MRIPSREMITQTSLKAYSPSAANCSSDSQTFLPASLNGTCKYPLPSGKQKVFLDGAAGATQPGHFNNSFPQVLGRSRQNYMDASEDDFVSTLTARKSNEEREVDIAMIHQSVSSRQMTNLYVITSQICLIFRQLYQSGRGQPWGGRESPNVHNERWRRE